MAAKEFASAPHAEPYGASQYAFTVPARGGLNWRHLASVVLLIGTIPVFAAAALVCLPVLVLGAAAQNILKICNVLPATPDRLRRLSRAR